MRMPPFLARRQAACNVFCVLVIWFGISVGLRAQSSSGSFIAAFRTPKHVATSKPDVFHNTVKEVVGYLESNNVDLLTDPLRDRIETQDPISIESLARITKDVGASYLLYIIVDRPITQWLKVTIECYDLSGKMLWRESAGYAGSFDVNSKKALPEIMKKLGKKLSARFDQPGLMLKKGASGTPSAAGEDSKP
jgi:hypothetical protein